MKTLLYPKRNGVDLLQVPIPDTYESIGMLMSGGMDSALLFSIIKDHIDLAKVTVYTFDLKQSVNHVTNLLAHMGASQVNRVTLPDPKQPNGELRNHTGDVRRAHDFIYSGDTVNPPWANFLKSEPQPDRVKVTQVLNNFVPFGLSYKDEVAHLYATLGKTDMLNLTWTCTERADIHCGHCFACRERKWAFYTAGVKDPIKYYA